MASKVYFTRTITPEKVVEMFDLLGKELPGKVAVKVHSGEKGNQNFLRPEFWKPMFEHVNGTIVETNTAYGGSRGTTEVHLKTLDEHHWTQFPAVILDGEGPDDVLEIPNGKRIKKNYVGKAMKDFDSMLVLSHFKGHAMGGFGGALKQLSIGCASAHGKAYIHGAGTPEKMWSTEQDLFLESMADAAGSVIEFFKGDIAYINVMKNLSVDCDCDGNAGAPVMEDVGILASLDPIAIDQACVDLVYKSTEHGAKHLIERMESRHGIHTIEAAVEHGYGTREYELIEVE